MSNFHERRRVLQLAGASAVASVAGCSEFASPESEEEVEDEPEDGPENDDVLTAIVEPAASDREELQEEVLDGELSQEEAFERQNELFEAAIDDFEERAESEADSDLRIERSEGEVGLYHVDGSADVLVDALRNEDISVLGQPALFDQLLQQQQQPEPEGQEIDEEDLEETDE
ncbi:hypothetical protein [Natrarchaeobius chitinivorans]|uniref:Uncharacterized protein n=1 Tax=Natrarchaeobius chitinivorans TaxID=1679083 RepID=A0A3N6LMV3_NATCH|nr:hypothetical protein [Natrarchaeobius chitinivorans]RQG90558.1 hypothetical protein EA473_20625 [Natrarchaeobius chitinivorans]